MPTIFSHAIFASAIGHTVQSTISPKRFWLLTWFCAILPDFDVAAFAFGIEYGSVIGHRGVTHSIAFAVLTGFIVAWVFFPKFPMSRWKLAMYFAAVTASHPLLDMLTDGGLGVALLAPFSNVRFFFPWRPIKVSPIGIGFFGERGLAVVLSEAIWIGLPSVIIVAASWLIKNKSGRQNNKEAA